MLGNLLEQQDPNLGAPWGTPITTYEYDQHSNLTKIKAPNPDGPEPAYPLVRPETIFAYDDLDRRTSMTDPIGRVTNYAYDALDRLFTVTGQDPDGAGGPSAQPVTTFKYDSVGNVVSVTDPLGRVTRTGYDLLYRSRYTVNAIAGISATIYDKAGRATSAIDELGRVTTYAYDDLDRMTSVVLPKPGADPAPEHKYLYDQVGNLKKYTDARNNVTDYTFDRLQQLTKVEQPEPTPGAGRPTTDYFYDIAGQLIDVKDPLNRHTSFDYDYRGQQTHMAQANPTSGIAINRPFSGSWTIDGPATVRQFDALGRVTLVTAPDPDGNPSGGLYVSPDTIYEYDALGRLTKLREPRPVSADLFRPETTYSYDAAGQLDLVTNPVGVVTDYDYDGLGRKIQETVGGSQITKYGYDLVGNQTSVVAPDPDGAGYLGSPITVNAYDRLNRLVSQQDARNGLTRFAYDAVGNLTSLTDPLDNVTSYVYDALDRQTREINPLNKKRNFEYDANGNLKRQVDRRGWVRQFHYDALNRNTEEKWFASVADANTGMPVLREMDFTVDKVNQLTGVTDVVGANNASATYGYQYDLLGRVTQSTAQLAAVSQSVTLDMTYDLLGRRESLKAKLGSTKDLQNDYKYDGLSRVKTLTQQDQVGGNVVGDKRADFTYDALGRFSTITRYSDVDDADLGPTTQVVTSTYAYEPTGLKRLAGLTHKHGTTTIDAFTWAYDNLNRVTSLTSSVDGVSAYQYDATGQLTFANHDGVLNPLTTDEAYVNDLNGNRRQSGSTGTPTVWTTDRNNRITSDGANSYFYDDEGNRTQRLRADGSHTDYVYDHRNRLVKVTEVSALDAQTKIVEYSYDVFDRRVQRKVDLGANSTFDTVENFVYDGDDVLLDILDADGANPGVPTVSKRYLHGPAIDLILAEESSLGTVRWYLADNLGTVRDLVDNAGSLVSGGHFQYDAYGNLTSGTTALTRYLYTGRERDSETGLQYNRARWYDPATGRWMSEDPIGFNAGDTNLTRYVRNASTNFADSTGKAPLSAGMLVDPVASGADVVSPAGGNAGASNGNAFNGAPSDFQPMSPDMFDGPAPDSDLLNWKDPLSEGERDALPRELGREGALIQARLGRLATELFETIRIRIDNAKTVRACECGKLPKQYAGAYRDLQSRVEKREAWLRSEIERLQSDFAELKALWEELRLGNRVSIRTWDSGTIFEVFIVGDDIFNPNSLPRYASHGRKWDIEGFDVALDALPGFGAALARARHLSRLAGIAKCGVGESFTLGRKGGTIVTETGLKAAGKSLLRSKVALHLNADDVLEASAGAMTRVYKDGSATIYLRANATRYEMLHEFQHVECLGEIGAAKYIELANTEEGYLWLEQYVYDKLQKHHFGSMTAEEIAHARRQIMALGGIAR